MIKEPTAQINNTDEIIHSAFFQLYNYPTILSYVIYILLGIGIAASVLNNKCCCAGVAYVAALGGALSGAAGLIGVSIGYVFIWGIKETLGFISAALFSYTIAFLFQYTKLRQKSWFMPMVVFIILSLIDAYGTVDITRSSISAVNDLYQNSLLGSILTYLYSFSLHKRKNSDFSSLKLYSVFSIIATLFTIFPPIPILVEISVSGIVAQTLLLVIILHTKLYTYPIAVMFGIALQFGNFPKDSALGLYLIYGLTEIWRSHGNKYIIIFYMLGVSVLFVIYTKISLHSISQFIECIFACCLYLLVSKNFNFDFSQTNDKNVDPYEHLVLKITDASRLINKLGNTISIPEKSSELHETHFYHVFDCAVEQVCCTCSKRELCWEKHYLDPVHVFQSVTDRIDSCGKLCYEDIPEYFRLRCEHTNSLILSINYELRRLFDIQKHAINEKAQFDLSRNGYQLFSEFLLDIISDLQMKKVSYDKQIYTAEVGIASKRKSGEEVSGDCARYFKTEDGLLYVVLSDGIGCGSIARSNSEYVVSLVEDSLKMISDPLIAISLINNVLSHNVDLWGYATLDLLQLNLCTGESRFYKIGSCNSYIYQDNHLSTIVGNSAMIGDLYMPSEIISKTVQLTPNTVIILSSDGIVFDISELRSSIKELGNKSMKFAAKQFLLHSDRNDTDDKTIIALRIQTNGYKV